MVNLVIQQGLQVINLFIDQALQIIIFLNYRFGQGT